ncbi:MAG TPA: 1-acyl-sn-glycerol-3-phosphate acyltransferase [Bacteroidia bacterium]|nr:1-acyl-sn-glycerol-3-phosphate acyltransferase [Bacteroidia bacterium]
MIYRLLAYWISFVFPTFYKRIQIRNKHWLMGREPAIIAINHPNAFTDPVGLCFIMYPERFWFLARGDVFKPGLISRLLDSIGIIPIYRMTESGKAGLMKNDATYQKVNHHLGRREKVIVFAEGICVMERRLRPLKKGVARMVFGAYESIPNREELLVIPVGVNYSQPDKFRSTLFYNVGEPIRVKDFLKDRNDSPAKIQNAFLQHLEPRLKELITHITEEKNDLLVLQAEELFKADILHSRGKKDRDLWEDYQVLKEITEKINSASEFHPEQLEAFRVCSEAYFNSLKKHRLRDWLIKPSTQYKVKYPMFILRVLLLGLGLPLFAAGFLFNAIPDRTTFFLTKKVVRTIEFYSSFVIAFAMPVFLFYYIILYALLYTALHMPWLSLVLLIGAMFCGWFSLYFISEFRKASSTWRLLRNHSLFRTLKQQRQELEILFNKI